MLKKNERGFTIIEVVLVLAIAGLIFLIVFLALPQLQKSRRDTQRKKDAARILGALETYAGNNNGQYPAILNNATFDPIMEDYLPEGITDPTTGNNYQVENVTVYLAAYAGGTYDPEPGDIVVGSGLVCQSGSALAGLASGGARNVAVVIMLEGGGSYCEDNA